MLGSGLLVLNSANWKGRLAVKLCAAQPRSDKQCGARLRRIGPRVVRVRRGWRVPAAVDVEV